MSNPSKETLRQAVETFWETFPPFWHRVRAHIRQAAAERFEISVEQFHILRNIRHGQGSVSELAEAKNISRAAISQGVDGLVNKGYITRTTEARDRRHVRLDLTPAGDTVLDMVFEDTHQWMMQTLSPLSEAEVETLIRAMEALRKVNP